MMSALNDSEAAIISMNSFQESGIFVLLKKYFGEKYLRYMQQVLIIILMLKSQYYSSNKFRTKCIGLLISILPQKLYFSELMPKKKIWDLPPGKENTLKI